MKGRAKLLDSGFREFIEYLQKMGELHNILRMIDSFNGMNEKDCSELDTGRYYEEKSGFNMLFSFWRKGWIEIRETERRRKDWPIKEYTLLPHFLNWFPSFPPSFLLVSLWSLSAINTIFLFIYSTLTIFIVLH